MNNIPLRSINYQWETNLYKTIKQLERKYEYEQQFGYKIISRNEDKTSNKITFSIYVPNKSEDEEYYLIHKGTNWKENEVYSRYE